MNKIQIFTGQDTVSNTTGTTYVPSVTYDKIIYCAKCGKQIDLKDDEHYCKFCGVEQYKTTTQGMFVYHWNSLNGENTYQ